MLIVISTIQIIIQLWYNGNDGVGYYNRRYRGGIYRNCRINVLHVMPELDSYYIYCTFISNTNTHLSTYFNACPN